MKGHVRCGLVRFVVRVPGERHISCSLIMFVVRGPG